MAQGGALKITSHGVLILCEAGELLLCHTTGTPRWDIPKGVPEPDETGVATAVRETQEECGLVLDPARLLDLGRFDYLRGKDLWLYAARLPRIDTALLACTSMYTDRRGQLRPEMDGFRWTPFGELQAFCGKSLASVLLGKLDLSDVLARSPSNGP